MALEIGLDCEDDRWRQCDDLQAWVEKTVQTVFHDRGLLRRNGEVAILLTSDAEIRKLNRDWRKIDKPTNVLSFPCELRKPLAIYGDIAIAYETSESQAREMAKPLRDHLAHLLVHGCLHLLGFDHIKTQEAEQMEALEVKILSRLGIADPYEGSELAREAT